VHRDWRDRSVKGATLRASRGAKSYRRRLNGQEAPHRRRRGGDRLRAVIDSASRRERGSIYCSRWRLQRDPRASRLTHNLRSGTRRYGQGLLFPLSPPRRRSTASVTLRHYVRGGLRSAFCQPGSPYPYTCELRRPAQPSSTHRCDTNPVQPTRLHRAPRRPS
jgi:hypothetical protein